MVTNDTHSFKSKVMLLFSIHFDKENIVEEKSTILITCEGKWKKGEREEGEPF